MVKDTTTEAKISYDRNYWTEKFGLKTKNITASCGVQHIEPFKRESPVWQTDGQNYDSSNVFLPKSCVSIAFSYL